MASQYLCMDPTMRIPKDILPDFEALKIVFRKESKGDVLKWVFKKYAPHIQALLRSNACTSTSSSGTSNEAMQRVANLSEESEVPIIE